MKKFLLGAAVLCAALSAAAFVWVLRTPWAPQTSFDIIGILWLFQNLPKLFATVVAVLLAALSLYLFLKGSALVGVADSRSLADEERRILGDPRFYGIARPRDTGPAPRRDAPGEPPAVPTETEADT